MSNRLFLIDGHALIFKMYYAFARRPMINSKGADMSILFGVTKYILEMLEREKPTHIAVALDPPGGTFRNEMFPEYKANRKETPQLVIDALEPLIELFHSLNIPTLMIKGFEADDVIGTVAKRLAGEETDVFMVTPDKDYGQLIGEHIFQLKPGKSGAGDVLLGKEEICAKYGISDPSQVIEILTLCGDTADNVPGVKGIGEVGAGKLIGRYGSVADIYRHLDELNEKQRAMFMEAEPHIVLSHELMTIKTDVPVDIRLDEMILDKVYSSETADLFEKYEFNSLKRFLGDISASVKESTQLETRETDADSLVKAAKAAGSAAVLAEYSGNRIFSSLERLTCSVESDGVFLTASGDAGLFKELLADSSVQKAGYNLKKLANVLRFNAMPFNGKLLDIELMHYLIDPEKSHSPEVLAMSLLGVDLGADDCGGETDSLFAVPSHNTEEKEAATYSALASRLYGKLREKSLASLYDDMEEPLLHVLADMEYEGVKVDLASLDSFAKELRGKIALHESKVRETAGNPSLNVSSPKQVGELLFEQLKLDPKAKKSARGAWTTDESTLLALKDRNPVIGEILEYRAAKKLLSTYIEPFPSFVARADGKIHTTLNQALTATGRLSSSNPNLQNIPIRTELGKNIRKAFVSSHEDGVIVSADYSQIELRIMAHLCGDEHMTEAFCSGVDIHSATAAKIFKVDNKDVTPEQRRIAKTANFGIMYGISAFGLSQNLGVSRTEAKNIIDDYFAAFPSIRTFIDKTLEEARANGYVETIFGRRRYLPDINAQNAMTRALAERNAVNAPIQGTSADIIKLAMIEVDRRMRQEGMRSRMVLQIHDELLFDAYRDEAGKLCAMVKEVMENVITLSIPLTVECNYGKNWLEAH